MSKVQEAAVQFDVVLGDKAQVSTTEDGDLLIEGWASDTGLDQQDEYFTADALANAARDFNAKPNRPLLYHHKPDHQLGEVLSLDAKGEGLWFTARIDKPTAGSWAEDVYSKVKRGTMKGVSVGGKFWRELQPDGKARIFKADFFETSITPLPVNPRGLMQVAQKAFPTDTPDEYAELDAGLQALRDKWVKIEKAVSQRPVE